MPKRNAVSGWQAGFTLGRILSIRVWTRQYAAVTLCVSVLGLGGCLHAGDPS